MRRLNYSSKVIAWLSIASVIGSVAGLLWALVDNIRPDATLVVSLISILIGVGAGIYSGLLSQSIRRLSRVFVSYPRSESLLAAKVNETLRNAGLKVWLDTEQLKVGQAWKPAIEKAIDDADYIVVILSKESRPNLAFELGYALAKRLRVIPVLVEPGAPVPSDIADLSYIDLVRDQERGLAELVQVLR